MSPEDPITQLKALFGSYRAEWLKEKIFDLFTKPAYFPDLETGRPCVLIGGRGTGKTTVLRSMSYEGQYALSKDPVADVATWNYYGIYHRINTNQVRAFEGPELPAARWQKLFAHYFNLLICEAVFDFLDWYALQRPGEAALPEQACRRIAVTLNLAEVDSQRELADSIEIARLRFEAYLNNLDEAPPKLSLQQAPVNALMDAISELPQFRTKTFFFMIDEYENLLDDQQTVVNTLIKHATDSYTFKIGVKELGWRRRSTLNPEEQLISPADYVRIAISEKLEDRFQEFAMRVCNSRLERVQLSTGRTPLPVEKLLPALSEEDEAVRLGVERHVTRILRRIGDTDVGLSERIRELPPLEIYFIEFWSKGRGEDLLKVAQEHIAGGKEMRERFGNYKHSMLFTLNKGHRGIHKYYAGARVFSLLAAGNIRYFLELVDQSLAIHVERSGCLEEPVDPETQTIAARMVGKKNLSELEGLTVQGARLTKLLLGLGRVFQVMAADAEGHTPEVNQFYLDPTATESAREADELTVDEILRAAVMHLALVRSPGSKLTDESDTKTYDYSVHPVYAPYFEFSHRRKRKMMLKAQQVLGLIQTPRETIRDILRSQKRADEVPLPEQLQLFEGFYSAA
ncbi:MAG: hypothetical protein ACRD1R_02430 [Acidobacteriota bacterium]